MTGEYGKEDYSTDSESEESDKENDPPGDVTVNENTTASPLQSKISNPSAKPLLIYFDLETTGLSIYNDHIVEVAAVLPSDLKSSEFQSLVKTSRKISSKG